MNNELHKRAKQAIKAHTIRYMAGGVKQHPFDTGAHEYVEVVYPGDVIQDLLNEIATLEAELEAKND